MNGRHEIETDQQLRKVLQSWEVEASLPPRFKEEVWRRIGQSERTHPPLWASFSEWMGLLSTRRTWAGAYIAVVLLIGVAAGLVSAEGYRAEAEKNWQAAYVESVSPLLQAELKP